eukprot:Nitzschia sp. Nitz4//scaffold19_size178191//16//1227//NITZ4_001949-RA/size178191-processed-gene-0.270-mRNA-1//-1//CDS//3329540595//4433//frame0
MGNACCQPRASLLDIREQRHQGKTPRKSVETDLTDIAQSCEFASQSLSKVSPTASHGNTSTTEGSLSPIPSRSPIVLASSQCLDLSLNEKVELGSIKYGSDNITSALGQGLPILNVVAKVPGNEIAGETTLSHPLIVEAAETLFASVGTVRRQTSSLAIWTSDDGKPCYTTVQFMGDDGKELTSMIGGETLSVGELAGKMIDVLRICGRDVPRYLELLNSEEKRSHHPSTSSSGAFKISDRKAVFGVHDYKLAEVDFAGIDHVIKVRVGTLNGQQVVEATYAGVSYACMLQSLTNEASHNIRSIYVGTMDEYVTAQMENSRFEHKPPTVKLPDEECIRFFDSGFGKDALRRTGLRYVPMTNLQAMKANKLVHEGCFHKATHLLSPRQGAILMRCFSNVQQRQDV